MFELNEVVIHKSAGACVVFDIVTKNFGTGDVKYYCLKPKFPSFVNRALEIYLPVDKGADFIRKPLTKNAVLTLINQIPSLERVWISDAKARKIMFDQIYQSGDMKGLCQLIKLLYAEPTFFAKPMSLTDKNFLTKIKTNVFDEFAVSLDVQPSEIEGFVKQYLI